MSIPGLNPSGPPAQAPVPIPPQIQPSRPGSPTLRNRPAQHNDQAHEDTASERGLKRGRPAEADEEGMDIETSTEPAIKRRRGEGETVTPERLRALIDSGDESGLRTLLQQAPELLNASCPSPIFQGLTPLCYAASKGLEAMVRCLIDCNASLEAASLGGMTPLMVACDEGHLKVAQLLMIHGANLAAKSIKGNSCLSFAVKGNNAELIDWLLSVNVAVDEPGYGGNTPLMSACAAGHLRVAQLLLSKGANLAAKNAQGNSCLHVAALRNRAEVAEWLLSVNVTIDEPGLNGLTPLMVACIQGHLKVAQLLLSNGANLAAKNAEGNSCLQLAVLRNRPEVVEWLLSENVSVDEPGLNDLTPLMVACGEGYLKVAQLLLSNRANLAAKNIKGNNCLHLAVQSNRAEVVEWLLGLNAPVDEPGSGGNTPLLYACGAGYLKIAQLLLSQGANLAAKNAQGLNCLHFAAAGNQAKVVEWLLEQGAAVDDQGGMKQPLLLWTFNKNYWETVGALIAGGANLKVVMQNDVLLGNKIFMQALKSDRYDVLRSLLEKKWPLPEGWDDLAPGNLPDDSPEAQRERVAMMRCHAEVRDLAKVFCGEGPSTHALEAAWLSPSGKSDRQYFINFYMNYFFTAEGEHPDQQIEDSNISQHPLFSHAIHYYLQHELSEPKQLLQALAGAGRPIPASYQKKVLWLKLQALTHIEQFKASFQNKHLAPDAEGIMVNILAQRLEALLMAAEAYFAEQFVNFPEVLTQLCKKYLKITGDFDAPGFSKALSKQGIYPINANRLAAVISQAWEAVCRRPPGLPSTEPATLGQVFQQSGPLAMGSLLAEIKVAVTQRPDASTLPGFRESFREGFMMSEREYLETYSEEIFGQWRQMWAGLGVILPDTFAPQQ